MSTRDAELEGVLGEIREFAKRFDLEAGTVRDIFNCGIGPVSMLKPGKLKTAEPSTELFWKTTA